jgi:hypothetical protein
MESVLLAPNTLTPALNNLLVATVCVVLIGWSVVAVCLGMSIGEAYRMSLNRVLVVPGVGGLIQLVDSFSRPHLRRSLADRTAAVSRAARQVVLPLKVSYKEPSRILVYGHLASPSFSLPKPSSPPPVAHAAGVLPPLTHLPPPRPLPPGAHTLVFELSVWADAIVQPVWGAHVAAVEAAHARGVTGLESFHAGGGTPAFLSSCASALVEWESRSSSASTAAAAAAAAAAFDRQRSEVHTGVHSHPPSPSSLSNRASLATGPRECCSGVLLHAGDGTAPDVGTALYVSAADGSVAPWTGARKAWAGGWDEVAHARMRRGAGSEPTRVRLSFPIPPSLPPLTLQRDGRYLLALVLVPPPMRATALAAASSSGMCAALVTVELKPEPSAEVNHMAREDGEGSVRETTGYAVIATSLALLQGYGVAVGDVYEQGGEGGGRPSCVVCLSAPASILLHPCRHLATCGECAAHLEKCPVCRAEAVGHFSVPESALSE